MKTVLVTGGAGFIGSHLVDRLLEDGYEVVVVDNLYTGRRENVNPKTRFFEVDITDIENLKKIFSEVRPEYVFHLAARTRVPVSIQDPVGTSHTNILGTINVLKAAADAEVKKVVFSSSSSVYGNQKELPVREDMVPRPLSPYGLQKLTGEHFVELFSRLHDIETVSLRYFNVYGPRVNIDSEYSAVIGKFLKLNKEQNPLTIFGDGKQKRAFCYVDDVVEANVRAMKSGRIGKGEVINVGGNPPVSVTYIAELIGGKVEYLPERRGDIRDSAADLTKAKELLEWEPRVDFKEGMQKTKEWFDKHYG